MSAENEKFEQAGPEQVKAKQEETKQEEDDKYKVALKEICTPQNIRFVKDYFTQLMEACTLWCQISTLLLFPVAIVVIYALSQGWSSVPVWIFIMIIVLIDYSVAGTAARMQEIVASLLYGLDTDPLKAFEIIYPFPDKTLEDNLRIGAIKTTSVNFFVELFRLALMMGALYLLLAIIAPVLT